MRIQDLLAPQNKWLSYSGGCGNCPRQRVGFVPATLKPTRLIVVGEAPGEVEVLDQEGFKGKSGQTIRGAFKDVGIPEHQYSLTNTLHCRPPENRDPHADEISCCMNQFVLEEVKDYPLVALVGSVAMNAFYPGKGYLLRGNLAYHPDFPNSRFYGMLHPAAIGYDSSRKDEFYAQVDRLGRIFRGGVDVPFTVVTGVEFAQRFAALLQTAKVISLDLETDRLESWAAGGEIRSLGVCSVPSKEVFVLDKDDPFWNTALQLLKVYLSNPEKQVLGQNIGFDLVWLEAKLQFKCDLRHIHDIQSLYYLYKRLRQVSIKRLVPEELDGYRHLVVNPNKEPNIEHLRLYNAEDVYYVQELFLKAFPQLKPQTRDLFITVGGPSSLATRRIQHAGIYFRPNDWDGFVSENRRKRQEAVQAWATVDPQFKPKEYIQGDGTRDIAKFLYEVKKYPVLGLTPSKTPSTDESIIYEMIRGGAKELENLLTIREMDKEYSTYLKPYPKLLHPDTSRIHASFHNTTTSTGRLSSTEPNMQNVKRGVIRNLFGCPAVVGSKFCEGDWSQIELRIAMSEADEPHGIEAYRAGKDLHEVTAQFITGKSKVTKEERTNAKPANFCLIYGGQPPTLQAYAQNTYGISMTEAESKRWHKGFFDTYPRLLDWHGNSVQILRENKGYMESAVGHIWYYPDWDSNDGNRRAHAERSAINMLCQGPASYFMTYLIYLVQQAFWKMGIRAPQLGTSEVVLTVHDQFAWEVGEDQMQLSIDVVRSLVQHVEKWASWMKVPIVLDIKVGEAWGSLREWK